MRKRDTDLEPLEADLDNDLDNDLDDLEADLDDDLDNDLDELDELDDEFHLDRFGIDASEAYDHEPTEKINRRTRRTTSHTAGRLTEQARARLQREVADASESPETTDAATTGAQTAPVSMSSLDLPPEGDRWSSWDGADEHGPEPRPTWVLEQDAAVDTELGVLKTGKEADVFLVERSLPGTELRTLLAAKRYRGGAHRLFHRDAGYLEGRRMKESREQRAVENRTKFGRNLIAQQWAVAEFAALGQLWAAGAPVPYPVQRIGTELLVEFVGDPDGTAAPRLAEVRPTPDELDHLWHRLLDALVALARMGLAHGDLSAYNILVHQGDPVLIDLPQVVDIVANPKGPEFLERDVRNIAGWFLSRGLPDDLADVDRVTAELLAEALPVVGH